MGEGPGLVEHCRPKRRKSSRSAVAVPPRRPSRYQVHGEGGGAREGRELLKPPNKHLLGMRCNAHSSHQGRSSGPQPGGPPPPPPGQGQRATLVLEGGRSCSEHLTRPCGSGIRLPASSECPGTHSQPGLRIRPQAVGPPAPPPVSLLPQGWSG